MPAKAQAIARRRLDCFLGPTRRLFINANKRMGRPSNCRSSNSDRPGQVATWSLQITRFESGRPECKWPAAHYITMRVIKKQKQAEPERLQQLQEETIYYLNFNNDQFNSLMAATIMTMAPLISEPSSTRPAMNKMLQVIIIIVTIILNLSVNFVGRPTRIESRRTLLLAWPRLDWPAERDKPASERNHLLESFQSLVSPISATKVWDDADCRCNCRLAICCIIFGAALI